MEHPISADASASGNSNRKRRRTVSTMTPSQLARKRANDREAQRAIRARTKEHIERLENEVQELKEQQLHGPSLHDLLHRNAALENEVVELRLRVGLTLNAFPTSANATNDESSTIETNVTARSQMVPSNLSLGTTSRTVVSSFSIGVNESGNAHTKDAQAMAHGAELEVRCPTSMYADVVTVKRALEDQNYNGYDSSELHGGFEGHVW